MNKFLALLAAGAFACSGAALAADAAGGELAAKQDDDLQQASGRQEGR